MSRMIDIEYSAQNLIQNCQKKKHENALNNANN